MNLLRDKNTTAGNVSIVLKPKADLFLLIIVGTLAVNFPFFLLIRDTPIFIFHLVWIDLLLFYIVGRQYKTFILRDNLFTVRFTFLRWFHRDINLNLENINTLRIERYSWQNRVSPILKIDFKNVYKSKKISFRFEEKKEQFQLMIDSLRRKSIHVICTGDVWK